MYSISSSQRLISTCNCVVLWQLCAKSVEQQECDRQRKDKEIVGEWERWSQQRDSATTVPPLSLSHTHSAGPTDLSGSSTSLAQHTSKMSRVTPSGSNKDTHTCKQSITMAQWSSVCCLPLVLKYRQTHTTSLQASTLADQHPAPLLSFNLWSVSIHLSSADWIFVGCVRQTFLAASANSSGSWWRQRPSETFYVRMSMTTIRKYCRTYSLFLVRTGWVRHVFSPWLVDPTLASYNGATSSRWWPWRCRASWRSWRSLWRRRCRWRRRRAASSSTGGSEKQFLFFITFSDKAVTSHLHTKSIFINLFFLQC